MRQWLTLLFCSWTDTGESAHHAAVSLGLKAVAPSSASKLGVIAKQQEQFPLYNGRPPKNCGFDVRLFHPAFENFSRRYHSAEELASNEAAAVHDFVVCSAEYYDSDKARQEAVTPFLETILGHDIEDIGTFVGGTILFTQSGTLLPILLFELKNEIGAGDADATHEAGLLYRKFWSEKKVYHPPFSLQGHSLTSPSGSQRACQLLLRIPVDSHGDHGYACLARCSLTGLSFNP